MSIQSVARFSSFLVLLLFSIQSALLGSRAMAQKFTNTNYDASVNVFGQFTGATSGDSVSDTPRKSMGGLASFRQSFRPWLGYEVNYSYTRFAEYYSVLPFSVQDNVHEATGAYLIQAPKVFVLQPFAAVGGGMLLYLPTTTGGQHYNMQYRPAFLFEFGANYPILSQHFGLRAEYRGLFHSTPDFNQQALTTGTKRLTSEPTAGIYVRF